MFFYSTTLLKSSSLFKLHTLLFVRDINVISKLPEKKSILKHLFFSQCCFNVHKLENYFAQQEYQLGIKNFYVKEKFKLTHGLTVTQVVVSLPFHKPTVQKLYLTNECPQIWGLFCSTQGIIFGGQRKIQTHTTHTVEKSFFHTDQSQPTMQKLYLTKTIYHKNCILIQ